MKIRRTLQPNAFPWTADLREQFGKIPDSTLAKRLGIHVLTVGKERRWLGIPPFQRKRPPFDWTAEAIALLGQATDAQVGAELGISAMTVRHKRTKLGIEAFSPRAFKYKPMRAPAVWTPERDALLGTEIDQEIADRLGLEYKQVAHRRRRLGIPGKGRNSEYDWERFDHLLGTMSDEKAAEQIGCSPSAVRRRRKELGIETHREYRLKILHAAGDVFLREDLEDAEDDQMVEEAPAEEEGEAVKMRRTASPNIYPWTDKQRKNLGRIPDMTLAGRLKVSSPTVKNERDRRDITNPWYYPPVEWTPEALSVLGQASDVQVARELGIAPGTVRKKRIELGIEACFPTTVNTPVQTLWTPERDALLGTEVDRKIAERLELTTTQVTYRRNTLKIPANSPTPVVDWESIDPVLGTVADTALAKQFGCASKTIERRRNKLDIPAAKGDLRMIARDDVALERLTRPTSEITEISSTAVANLRKELDIAHPPRRTTWTPEVLARLGKVDDHILAEELGLSPETVSDKRQGTGRLLRPHRPKWSAEELALLEEIPDDKEAAERLGRTRRAIAHVRLALRRKRA